MTYTKFAIALLALFVLMSESFTKKNDTKNVQVEAMDVKGLILKPQAYYILNKSDLAFESHEEEFPAVEKINKQLMDPLFKIE